MTAQCLRCGGVGVHTCLRDEPVRLRLVLPDGSSWPRPAMESDDVSGVGWKARYNPDGITRADLLALAAIADAYGHLLCDTTQKRRDYVCREMRSALAEEAL